MLTLDGSRLSKLALPVAEATARSLNVPLTLFEMAHITVPYTDDMGAAPVDYYSQLAQDEEDRVRKDITELEKSLKDKGLDVSHEVLSGFDAASNIIDTGKKVKADMVVMSTHGRSGISHFLLGSVAEKVLRHGDLPLLLVNARAG